MEWRIVLMSLFASMGGCVGIAVIMFRFLKKRVEVYIDDAVKYKFDKQLEEHKQSLNKQLSMYESFKKRYSDYMEIIIKGLDEIEKYIEEIQICINRCLEQRQTLEFMLKRQDAMRSVEGVCRASRELEHDKVMRRIYLSEHMTGEIEVILNLLDDYLTIIRQETENLQIDGELYQKLLDKGKVICNKIDSLSGLIREENLKQSGEL